MSLRAFSKTILIINDYDTAVKLLDKRSSIYSDRPVMPMLTEAMGWRNTLGLSPYGERFRRYRKLLHQFMGTRSAIEKYAPLMESEIAPFLRRVVAEPDRVQAHLRRYLFSHMVLVTKTWSHRIACIARHAGAVILMMTYGYSIQEENDPVVEVVDRATTQFARASTPGAFLVDTLPMSECIRLRFVMCDLVLKNPP